MAFDVDTSWSVHFLICHLVTHEIMIKSVSLKYIVMPNTKTNHATTCVKVMQENRALTWNRFSLILYINTNPL